MRRYNLADDTRIGDPEGQPVVMCPSRFQDEQVVIEWLAEIAGFRIEDTSVAREVPFMMGTNTGRPAGMIDLVVANSADRKVEWYGLEIQAVYFSGRAMRTEFEALTKDSEMSPPFPVERRRPDWRSSGAKRLMPQLQIKAPTVRRWNTKMAVAVDRPFLEAIGGPSSNPSRDLGDGDIIWLVVELDEEFRLTRWHWEVLTLEDSSAKLLAARTIRQADFEQTLIDKLEPLINHSPLD